MINRTFQVSRRGLLLGGSAALAAANLPPATLAQEPIKMEGIYTVPVEQQWVSRIHIAAEALKASGAVDYSYTENVANTDYPRVMREYCESGVKPIVSEIFGAEAEAREVCAEYPDVAFLMGSSFLHDEAANPNLAVFDNYIQDAAYLSGIVAGGIEVFGQRLPPGNPRAALAVGVGMVHQHFTLAGNLTVLDNITLGTESLWSRGLGRSAARSKVEKLSSDFGLAVHPDAKVGKLSVGERQRVEILKALYRDARILILDELTAVLTPQEADALFATLRKATAMGLSIIFISHKLHEVMAIADRCIVLRHGRVVGTVDTHATDKGQLAALMVGGELSLPRAQARAPGPVLMQLDRVSTPNRGAAPGLKELSLALHSGQITGLAGVSGNGQAVLADLISGLAVPTTGTLTLKGERPAKWSPRLALAKGVARIPEDRHHQGTIADFDLTENSVLEAYANPRFSRRGWMNWRAARTFAEEIITGYDVRCPGPGIRIRLLSGGNMQKLILGRAMTGGSGADGPEIVLANQPVRGLDVGAIAYVQSQLIAARDRGAAMFLISEDLDEIMGLSDVIHVISQGRLSPGFARGTMTAAELGLWMAGQNFGEAPNAA